MNRCRDPLRRSGWYEHRGITQHLPKHLDIRGDHRRPERHCLQRRKSEAFFERWLDQGQRTRIQPSQFIGVDVSGHIHAILYSRPGRLPYQCSSKTSGVFADKNGVHAWEMTQRTDNVDRPLPGVSEAHEQKVRPGHPIRGLKQFLVNQLCGSRCQVDHSDATARIGCLPYQIVRDRFRGGNDAFPPKAQPQQGPEVNSRAPLIRPGRLDEREVVDRRNPRYLRDQRQGELGPMVDVERLPREPPRECELPP